jgi:hypothetical protein
MGNFPPPAAAQRSHCLLEINDLRVGADLLHAGTQNRKEQLMLDLILLALGLGFFALAVGYTVACDRL